MDIVRWCKFFGHVPKLTFIVVNIFRSYSNRNLVILIRSCKRSSLWEVCKIVWLHNFKNIKNMFLGIDEKYETLSIYED